MKKIAYLMTFMLFITMLTSCNEIENTVAMVETSQSTTAESSAETSFTTSKITTTTEQTTTEEQTITSQTLATASAAATTTKAVTIQTATAIPVTTTVATTQATTTPAAITTTTAEVTTTAAPIIATPQSYSSSYNALNYQEQKAMWISFWEFNTILKGKSETQFRKSVQTMYNDCVLMGLNTVYVHVRAYSDSFYDSDLFPWSKYVTGTIGVEPSFDPFQILVDEAHSRGLSIHAWINPMRGVSDTDMQIIPNNYVIKQWYNDPNKNGTYLVKVGTMWYYSPAYQEVRDLITDGAKEIISKYNVDGIHIDDYFYPTTESYFDSAVYTQSGYSNLSQWRLDTVSSMVKELYKGIKSANPTVLFGISPQGNINNNYSTQYADVKKWCANPGYMDYVVPQIYFGYKNTIQPYETNLQSWCDMVTCPDVDLIVGLAAYKIGTTEDKAGEWENDTRILARQVESFREKPKYGGVAFFRYESLFLPNAAVASKVEQEKAELVDVLT